MCVLFFSICIATHCLLESLWRIIKSKQKMRERALQRYCQKSRSIGLCALGNQTAGILLTDSNRLDTDWYQSYQRERERSLLWILPSGSSVQPRADNHLKRLFRPAFWQGISGESFPSEPLSAEASSIRSSSTKSRLYSKPLLVVELLSLRIFSSRSLFKI